ncbi:MAG: SUF system NifU family Fe-S cluster assembly protein [Cellulomonadaceae bacterium]|jgi:nitrogen fixation NifU-like protein|nr:SUF system NifU family Fe-S cluster assembly protein [Cellulomonadaceae bacterium]
MSELAAMYQQVILDAAKHPVGKTLDPALADSDPSPSSPADVRMVEPGPDIRVVEPGREATDGRNPRTVGTSHQYNPICGDEITLRVVVDHDHIADVQWMGQGCSISQASASIMVGLTQGSTVASAQHLDSLFHDLMNSRGKGLENPADEDALEDANAFVGTSLFPARIKCALLGWAALKDALLRAGVTL